MANLQTKPTETWWLILLEGIAAIVVGLLLLVAPGETLVTLIQIVGLYLLVRGMLAIIHIFLDRRAWGAYLLGGVLGILAGIVVLNHPLWVASFVPMTLSWVVGVGAIAVGIVGLVQAYQGASFGYAIVGAFAILIGAPFFFQPISSIEYLPVVLGALGVIGGIAAVVIAFRSKPA